MSRSPVPVIASTAAGVPPFSTLIPGWGSSRISMTRVVDEFGWGRAASVVTSMRTGIGRYNLVSLATRSSAACCWAALGVAPTRITMLSR